MINVYFDEAGNTGHDLLNQQQPLYVLSSTDMAEEEAQSLLAANFSSPETLHFKTTKRTAKGERELLTFASSNLQRLNARFRCIAIHKEYMITCQMLNYLLEPQLYRDGIDYYDEGMNIHHASVFYYGAQVILDKGPSRSLYKAFIEMFRRKTASSIRDFYSVLHTLRTACSDKSFAGELLALETSVADVRRTLSVVDKYTLDPAMHALIDLTGRWNDQYPKGFGIVHDRSDSIRNQKQTLDYLINLKTEPTRVGYAISRLPILSGFSTSNSETATLRPR